MNCIQQLESIKDKVEDMLKGKPELRNADPTILSIWFWKYYDDLDLTAWIPKLTNTETIVRARRLLVVSNPSKYGPTDKDVINHRLDKEQEYQENL